MIPPRHLARLTAPASLGVAMHAGLLATDLSEHAIRTDVLGPAVTGRRVLGWVLFIAR